jgi:hypothetical protein
MATGKFHGVIKPQTPTGSLTVETRLPGTDTCRRTTGGFLAEPFNEGRSVLDLALGLSKRFSILPRKIGPALAASCTVVAESLGETPFTANALAN